MDLTFICEVGVNHLGQFDRAIEMIKKAKEVGATHVKFQKYNPIQVLGKDSPYLKDAHQLSWKELTELSGISRQLNLKFGCSVFDVNDIPIVDHISDFHKIATRMNHNTEFISKIDECKKLTYMSIQPNMGIRIPERFKLMWCIAEYPSLKSDIVKYPYSNSFGLSSHCPDITASIQAFKQGARVFEHHVKLSDKDIGCDMNSSLTFEEYKEFIISCKS